MASPQRTTPPTFLERFWAKVECGSTKQCWLWRGAPDGHYGRVCMGRYNGRRTYMRSSRFSYELHHGPIPTGLSVLHRCDMPRCVNPAHLFVGTQLENIADRDAKGRHRPLRGDANGQAKLSWEQVAELRSRYEAGDVTQVQLATDYGISQSAVSYIVRGEHWVVG